MRLMRCLLGVITCSCLGLTPAVAYQHVHHATPTPTSEHPTAPVPPATSPTHPAAVPVPQKLAANPALVTRLQPLLPSGMTIVSAATGFKNQGQFIAALHVSHNLNIPFAQLKTAVTGSHPDSLGQAIHELKPAANVKAAVKTAEQQAKADINATRPAKADRDKDDQ
jgi:hypothetical protein